MRILDPGERIVVTIRKHWLVFALKALILGFGGVLPLIIVSVLPPEAVAAFTALPQADIIATFLYLLWLLILWVSVFVLWTNYYLDVWIVSDKRLIDIDQKALFRREITTTRLEKIQDVTVYVDGLLATLFGFGVLTIHTAGDNPDIVIRNAANPGVAKERIMEAYNIVLDRGVKKDFV